MMEENFISRSNSQTCALINEFYSINSVSRKWQEEEVHFKYPDDALIQLTKWRGKCWTLDAEQQCKEYNMSLGTQLINDTNSNITNKWTLFCGAVGANLIMFDLTEL